jgi:hypothetical protein
MATYSQVQEYVKRQYHCTVKTHWIAHVKELNGMKPRVAHNRISAQEHKFPCPVEKRIMIEKALKYFGDL